MKEKIYRYIHEKDRGVPSQEIIKQFFHVFNHYPPQMDAIITAVLKDDPRFVRDEVGEWHVQQKDEKQALDDIVFSIVEIDTIPIDRKSEVPVVLGIAQITNNRLISNSIFPLEISAPYSQELRKKIDESQVNLLPEQFFSRNAEKIYNALDKTIVVSYAPSKILAIIDRFFRNQIGLELEVETISLVQLARKLIPGIKIRSVEDIASSLSIPFNSPLDLKSRLDVMSETLFTFINEFKQLNIQSLTDLRTFIETTKIWVDFSNYNFNKDDIKNLPSTPGIYLMKDRQGQIFYVGKAKNLLSRVESYFVNRFDMDEKSKSILMRLYDLTYEQAGSELEALLLENQYINQYQPEINKQVKIHPFNISKYKIKKIVIFLETIIEDQISLYLVREIAAATKVVIDRQKTPDWKTLRKMIQQLFFEDKTIDNIYSLEQIEIIWRWFSVNRESINFVDVDRCGNIDDCLETIKNYCADKNLFSEKFFLVT